MKYQINNQYNEFTRLWLDQVITHDCLMYNKQSGAGFPLVQKIPVDFFCGVGGVANESR